MSGEPSNLMGSQTQEELMNAGFYELISQGAFDSIIEKFGDDNVDDIMDDNMDEKLLATTEEIIKSTECDEVKQGNVNILKNILIRPATEATEATEPDTLKKPVVVQQQSKLKTLLTKANSCRKRKTATATNSAASPPTSPIVGGRREKVIKRGVKRPKTLFPEIIVTVPSETQSSSSSSVPEVVITIPSSTSVSSANPEPSTQETRRPDWCDVLSSSQQETVVPAYEMFQRLKKNLVDIRERKVLVMRQLELEEEECLRRLDVFRDIFK